MFSWPIITNLPAVDRNFLVFPAARSYIQIQAVRGPLFAVGPDLQRPPFEVIIDVCIVIERLVMVECSGTEFPSVALR